MKSLSRYVSRKLTVAVPWSLPQYIVANGFHPLYKPFFIYAKELGVKCLVLDEFKTQRMFYHCPRVYMGFIKQQKLIQRRDEFAGPANAVKEFFKLKNLCLQQSFPGQIEFHHTCAFAIGTRPYIFHCESFLPVFFPMFKQGEGLKSTQGIDIEAIKNHYLSLFEDKKCLMIVSHINETLIQFNDFFKSEIINKKVMNIPIGLDELNINNLMNGRIIRSKDLITFLFISSAHQNSATFRLRGGAIAIKLLNWFRINRRAARFIFRCARPSEAEMHEFGLSHIDLDSCPYITVEWLVSYMTDEEISRLFAVSHFLILLSANLHSVSIMQAMAAGCIPITIDTQGVYEYIDDQVNGLVVTQMKEKFWEFSEKYGIWFDCHSKFYSLEEEIFQRLIEIISKSIDDREKMGFLSVNAIAKANQHFRAAPYVKKFWQTVIQETSHIKPALTPPQSGLLKRCKREVEIARDFGGPIIPILVNRLESLEIYRLRNIFWIFPNFRPAFSHDFTKTTIFSRDVVKLRRKGGLFFEEVEANTSKMRAKKPRLAKCVSLFFKL